MTNKKELPRASLRDLTEDNLYLAKDFPTSSFLPDSFFPEALFEDIDEDQ